MRTLRELPRSAWWVSLATLLLLLALDVWTTIPALPSSLLLRVKLPIGVAGRTEPLVAAGSIESGGNFLLVTYQDEQTAVFSHEAADRSISSARVIFKPGESYSLRLEMPALASTAPAASAPAPVGTIRLTLDGHDLIRGDVPFRPTARSRIFFAENPVGWATLGASFRGEITREDGKPVRGRAHALFTAGAKLRAWCMTHAWHLAPLLLVSVATGWLAQRFFGPRTSDDAAEIARHRALIRARSWGVAAVLLNLIVFGWLMTGGKFRFSYPDAGGAFYDFQAQSLLQGRLDVPESSLGGEAFLVGGKAHSYFGLTPAVLRLPFVASGIGFGHMTRSFLFAHFLACLAAGYFLLGYATRKAHGRESSPSPWAVVLMICATGIGSTLLFLGSRAYVYHEAILCGVAFAAWSSYFSLRYLEDPRCRWWLAALTTGVFSVQARPTTGLFALGLLGAVALMHLFYRSQIRGPRWAPWMVGGLAALGLFSVQAVGYLRFGSLDASPLQYNVQYTPERLAKIDGKKFHVANVPHNLDAYLVSPAFTAVRQFPFFAFDLTKRVFSGARMDLEENTVALPFAMSGLVLLAVSGCVAARKIASFRRPLAATLIASLPCVAAMLTFIATSHRYTADAVPALVIAAAFGMAHLDSHAGAKRSLPLVIVTGAAAFSFLLTAGLSLHFQVDLVWGVPEELRQNVFQVRGWSDRWFGVTRP